MSLRDHVERFVAHKRSLGCKYENEESLLLSWADYATIRGEAIIHANSMIQWARQSSTNEHARKRLVIGCRFARWIRAEDGRHEVPHPECLGPHRIQRRVPFLLSDDQVRMLMDAALQLPPAGSITPYTIHFIIGLIAATGLRRSEACSLLLSDFTEDGLVIRDTKFGKSRLVPLSDCTRDALYRYLGHRKTLGVASDHMFMLRAGRQVNPSTLSQLFYKLARVTGLHGGKGERGVTLHDLRHRFAVRSLEQAIATDRDDISRHILALSTYMGHVGVSSTYHYLHATPALLRRIAEKTEAFHLGRITS